MREIKFRAWDKEQNKMIFNPIINDIDSATNYIGLNNLFKKYIDRGFIIMQYTGLKDKKRTAEYPDGQEIYEGDILTEGKRNMEVYFENGCFSVKKISGIDSTSSDWFFLGSIEFEEREWKVIGNIYENPELIN